jgi:hypothetical protein
MFGINLSGAEFGSGTGNHGFDYIYPSSASIEYYASKGVEMIRLPVKWERLQDSLNGPVNVAEINRIKAVMDIAQTNGVKVLIDIHNYGAYNDKTIGSADVPISSFSNLWGKIAAELKSHPALEGYGLMNEPIGFTNAQTWPDSAQAAINAIRAVDTSTAIYVSGQNWGSAMDWPQNNDSLKFLQDPSKNLVFEAHQYFDRWNSGTYQGSYDAEEAYANVGVDRLQPFIRWLADNNLKGFIGEYAVPNNDPRWLTVMDNFLAELSKHNISSAYWGGGPWWGSYPLSIEPNGTVDSVQMNILKKNIEAYAARLLAENEIPEAPPPPIPVNEITGTSKNETMTGINGRINILYGMKGSDTLKGADLDDALYGGNDNDKIYGGNGDDYIDGSHGDDILYGDNGKDSVSGGDGNDYMNGGNGDDILSGGNGNDKLYGREGNDTLNGDAGNDLMYGENGSDTLNGMAGIDTLYGGIGDDILDGGIENDTLYGDDGHDMLHGGDGNDYLSGGTGDDIINGGSGDDKLHGQNGNDRLSGDSGDDLIYGLNGDDIMNGDAGKDTVYGGDGLDSLYGGDGIDWLYGQNGDDIVYGETSNDILYGGTGNDRIYGGDGNDMLYGEVGNDVFYSGHGADSILGGLGKDVFIFEAASAFSGIDTISDFKKKEFDTIDLSRLLSNFDPLTQMIENFVRITTKGKDSLLSIDMDGDGNSFNHIATLKNVTGLTDEQSLVNSGHLIVN